MADALPLDDPGRTRISDILQYLSQQEEEHLDWYPVLETDCQNIDKVLHLLKDSLDFFHHFGMDINIDGRDSREELYSIIEILIVARFYI